LIGSSGFTFQKGNLDDHRETIASVP
jgi:hypothetical protein